MQQELIEMLEKVVDHVVFCNGHDQRFSSTTYGVDLLKEADVLIEKAKNKVPAVPQGEPDFWGSGDGCWVRATDKLVRPDASRFNIPLYAAPSQPVTLTEDEIDENTVWLDQDQLDTVRHCDVSATVHKCIAALRAKENKL